MKSRYDEGEAERTIARYAAGHAGKSVPRDLALRTYTARLLGADAALVLHGGGNTSVKSRATTLLGDEVDVLYVKGSGWDLATIEPPGHPAVRLAPLMRLRALASLTDEEMVNELRLDLLDATAPTPSVETLLHAYLPAKYIDHTHADAILTVSDQPDGEARCRAIFGDALVWVPYVMPGFALAKRCAEAFEAAAERARAHDRAAPSVMVLQRHGLFTWGESAKESYERTIDAVSRAEAYIAAQRKSRAATGAGITATGAEIAAPQSAGIAVPMDLASAPNAEIVAKRAFALLPRLRGALAAAAKTPHERAPIVVLDDSPEALAFASRADAAALVDVGCATPDHVIRTKPSALFLPSPRFDDPAALSTQLASAIADYAARYDAYFADACARREVTKTKLAPWPVVFVVPGLGVCAAGKTVDDARVASEIYAHTMRVMSDAADIGAYRPVDRLDLFDVEYWSLEQAKLKPVAEAPLSGRVALVTGAASGIGRATAERFLALGAHVVLVDRGDVATAAREIAGKQARRIAHVACDVTSESDVARAIAHAVRAFGGLDVVVSNAGNAPEGRLDTAAGADALRASLDLNLVAHNHVARAASAVMLAQGRGGALLFNASKSAFNQGPGFGPYAVAKAGLVALMRQYAVDLGPFAIRANAVNADRIRTALFGGGVLESRAAARGLTPDDYFRANLLKREVTALDVADAFAYLATAPATTGCVVTVDGGNAAAFPR